LRDDFTLQTGHIGDEGNLVARDQNIRVAEQGFGKDQPFVTLQGAVYKTQNLTTARHGGFEVLVPGVRHKQFDAQPNPLAHQGMQVCGNADVVVRFVNDLKRSPVLVHTQSGLVGAISKLSWIRDQQMKLQAQARVAPRQFVQRETHMQWGRRYLLCVVEKDARLEVTHNHRSITLYGRPGSTPAKREEVMHEWHRSQ